ncbi:hypothetical protein LVD17_15810 [Fulvivirga ulvae]|uniref:hypothetical protein n=1 Tax=Fulvivirga ulvae TaxID=2904245 RepID=UPI001F197663|nr:hypothetical protein [Fulvivirga ulvae]UII29766.1 hypothetical protein LVD17_15810 [Fulvivirga ulvae]
MTKFLLAGLLFISVSLALNAQKVAYEHKFDGYIEGDFLGFPDASGNMVTSYLSYINGTPKIYKTHLVFKTANETKDIVFPGKLIISGYSYDDRSFTFFYQNQFAVDDNQPVIDMIQISKDGLEMLGSGKLEYEGESIISNFQYNGLYYLITASKSKEDLIVRTISGPDQVNKRVFSVSKNTARKLSKMRFSFIQDDFEMPIQHIVFKNKIFFHDNKLIMITPTSLGDSKEGQLNLVSLDLDSKSTGLKHFSHKFGSYNYFPYKGKLYFIHLNKKALILQIRGVDDLTVIREYSYTPDKEVNIFNSPVYKETEVVELDADKNLAKQKFKEIGVGEEFINVIGSGDEIKLMIGSAVFPGQKNLIPGQKTVSTPASPGYYKILEFSSGTYNKPGYKPETYMSYTIDDATKYYVYGYLNASDYTVSTGQHDHFSAYYNIESFVEKERDIKKSRISSYNIYNSLKNIYLISYSKKSNMLTVRSWDGM